MRIVHVLSVIRLELGGVVRAVLDLAGTLARSGVQIDLLTVDDTDVPPEWRDAQPATPRVVRLPGKRGPFNSFQRHTVRALERELAGADLVHLHGCWEYCGIQTMRLCRRMGIPYVLSAHGMLDDWSMPQSLPKKKIFLHTFGYKAFTSARAIHATATIEGEQIPRWLPNHPPIEVLPLAMDVSEYETLPGPELARQTYSQQIGDRPFALLLARLYPGKGIEIAIRAVALRRQRGEAICDLVIAGTGDQAYLNTLHEIARSEGVSDLVHFLGMVRGPTKLSLYQASSVFVLPTSHENFGLVLPEAMACETAVITTKGTNIWPDLHASGGALIVDRTPDAFAEAITELLANPLRLETMGASGRAWVFKTLEPGVIAERYLSLYRRVLAPGCHEA